MSAGLSRKSRNWDSATTMKGREGSGIERQGAGTDLIRCFTHDAPARWRPTLYRIKSPDCRFANVSVAAGVSTQVASGGYSSEPFGLLLRQCMPDAGRSRTTHTISAMSGGP